VINVLDFLEPGALALLITVLIAGIFGFATGKVVPRSLYDKEVERGDKESGRADKATEGLSEVAGALKNLTDEIRYGRRREG